MTQPEPTAEQTDLVLRTSRRALVIVMLMVLGAGATVIAHELRPGSVMADWASKAPWIIPMVIVTCAAFIATAQRKAGAAAAHVVLNDEFRQTNLARAQRVALIVTVIAQLPLAIALAGQTTVAAVTVMGVATVTIALIAMIVSFLIFDRG